MTELEILNIEQNIDFSEWRSLLRAIKKFTGVSHQKKSISDIYKEGLEVFSTFPDSRVCALYLLNNQDYQFELKSISNQDFTEFVNKIFDNLIDNGKIGLAIDGLTIVNTNLDDNLYNISNVFVIPLRVSWGVNGIALIFHERELSEFDQFLYNFIGLFADLLGSTIENVKMLIELELSKSTLEQKIATRTLDLAQSRRELKAIFDSVLTGVIVFDMTINKIVRVNPMACNIIGLLDSQIVGKNIFDFLEYFDYTQITEDTGKQNYYESSLSRPDGSKVIILRNTTKLLLNNRVLINESFVDITKLKEAEKALTNTNELLEMKVKERTEDLYIIVHKLKEEIRERELAEQKIRKLYEEQKELSDLKNRFVSMVSHEFRTPLTLIKSSVQMVRKFRDKLTSKEQEDYLERIVFSVDNLTDLIENVIFIGKNDAKKLIVNKSDINIEELLKELCELFVVSSKDDISFDYQIDIATRIIHSDEKILRIVLTNLISNAIKYSGSSDKIILKTGMKDKEVYILVKDFGIGIPPEEQERIFELFYRAKNVNSVSGTGLGLTVVTESLTKLDGRLELNSKIDEGSEFTIYLPGTK
ncbi:hypothetical protein MASR1M45_27560 [Candidatus Kapaibacterium sp.]